jgi:hypothetical protein
MILIEIENWPGDLACFVRLTFLDQAMELGCNAKTSPVALWKTMCESISLTYHSRLSLFERHMAVLCKLVLLNCAVELKI